MFQSVHAFKIARSAMDCQAKVADRAYPAGQSPRDYFRMLTNADIGRAIDHLMVKRGHSQKQLAQLAGDMDTANLNRIIRGKQAATTERLEVIAKALGVKVWEIYRLAEEGTPPEAGDPRKAALHDLIEAIDPSQLDSVFRRWPDDAQKSIDTPQKPKHRRRA